MLLNVAGLATGGPLTTIPEKMVVLNTVVNTVPVVQLTHALLPYLAEVVCERARGGEVWM